MRSKLLVLFDYLESGNKLSRADFKKLTSTDLLEFKYKKWRLIGAWHKSDFIIVVIFYKQSQATPKQILQLAVNRLNDLKS